MAKKNEETTLANVSYETVFGDVQLDPDTVKNYLVKGNGAVTDAEVFLFIKMCQAQKLNPFVTGEVYLIKYDKDSSKPAQMVIGYDTYKRRAEENPEHLYYESGIVVMRGSDIVKKEGACLYKGETLLGGWCKVHKLRNNVEVTPYAEVSIEEYSTGKALWYSHPCTMIEKVAVSQCLRKAYPKEFEGLFTAEEVEYQEVAETVPEKLEAADPDNEKISQEDRQMLFKKSTELFGKERGNKLLKQTLVEKDIESTEDLTKKQLKEILDYLNDIHQFEQEEAQNAEEQQ